MALNAIVDLSHFNKSVDLVAAKGDGILAVIHKATQGLTFFDPTYSPHRERAKTAGLLWGSYHFGTGGDGAVQADFFLRKVEGGPSDLLVLDFEKNTAGASMTLDQARAFVSRVHSATGRWPGFYSGNYIKELLGAARDPVLGNCWFWLAQYDVHPIIPPAWDHWTMWQYTNGVAGPEPHTVAGIGPCDRDRFNGSADDLPSFWNGGAAEAATTTD